MTLLYVNPKMLSTMWITPLPTVILPSTIRAVEPPDETETEKKKKKKK